MLGQAAAMLLAACSQQPQPANTTAGVAAPAPPADRIPDAPAPTPALVRDVGEPAVAVPGAPRPTSLSEGPFAADSGQAGADAVQTYVALLGEGRVRDALRLWDRGASGKPDAADLARYRRFHADVGGPGQIEGAAGSRYVTVPVRFDATLRNGRRLVEEGTVTLRRVGEVDGATPEQKRWHIFSIDVRSAQPRR